LFLPNVVGSLWDLAATTMAYHGAVRAAA